MKPKSEYQDVRWQKKRLETLEAHGWTCEMCDSKGEESMLHVHHRWYTKGKPIWDAEQWQLTVLCGKCHDAVTEIKTRIGVWAHRPAFYDALDALLRINIHSDQSDRDVAAAAGMLGALADALTVLHLTCDELQDLRNSLVQDTMPEAPMPARQGATVNG